MSSCPLILPKWGEYVRCEKCKVELRGKHGACPLCQGDLSGDGVAADNVFAALKPQRIHRRVLSWIALAAVAVTAVSVSVNLSFPDGGWWSLFVAGGIGSLWLSLSFAIKKRGNLPKNIIWQVGIISALTFAWDMSTGFYKWSLNFVIPILCICALIAMAATAKLLKQNFDDVLIYFIIDIILGFFSFILLIAGVLTVVYPAAACFACSAISLAALILLRGKSFWAELQRRLHV